MSYNFDITDVSYDDDEGYQQTVCKIFTMDYEDYNCDNPALNNVLDSIYLKTHTHPLFQKVYIQSASFMFSEDPEIGLSVLFAYDNLPLFHTMLVAFHVLGDQFDDKHLAYVNLHNKLFS